MSFLPTDQQIEFRDALRKFLAENVSLERVRREDNSNDTLWSSLGALGLPDGFIGADRVFSFGELAIVASECGRALVSDPVADSALIFGELIWGLFDGTERETLRKWNGGELPGTKGEKASCASPSGGPLTIADLAVNKVSGTIQYIPNRSLDWLLARCEISGARSFILLKTNTSGVQTREERGLDFTQGLTSVTLKDANFFAVPLRLSAKIESQLEVIRACEIAGACKAVTQMTQQYVTEREQFGVSIGGFQAIQHKLSDMYLQAEALEALTEFAAWAASESQEQLGLTAKSAILYASSAGPSIIESSIQAHGGMGFTWEHNLHLYLRRVRAIAAMFGGEENYEEIFRGNSGLSVG